jgi:UDP-N-acetylglucosamine--dolichyl-phosphate N-acetylglucosaminephosphotransferase
MRLFTAFLVLTISFAVAFLFFRVAIPRLRRAGIVGRDMHKPDQTYVPEMGGLFLVAGFSTGVMTIIALNTFSQRFLSIDLVQILAVLSVVLIAALIGIADDLIGMRQSVKAFLPLLASLPLIAIRAGETAMRLPLIGVVDFGVFYTAILVPLGITGAANAANMLAGFNGMEAGTGLVAMASLAAVAWLLGETAALLILLAAIGALLATLYYNWYPAKVFIGDTGTLTIGALIASAVIIGNFETAGVIVIIPYALDFLIKAKNRFPTSSYSGSWATCRDGKLFCPESGPMGVGLLIVKLTGGTKERNVALILMGLEAVCGAVAIWFYW